MSLVGNLEDLGLGEILQIVSLSRKSGVLQLKSREREGRVIFLDGQVIRATSSTLPENLGDLVVRNGLVDLETLKQSVLLQQKPEEKRRIGDILVAEFAVARDSIEKVVREQVEKIVYSFFGWDEGSFSFELGEQAETASTNLDPLQFMLDQGLNPQWLAMEGSRLLDEKRHRGEDTDVHGESHVDIDQLLADVKNTIKAPTEAVAATAPVVKKPVRTAGKVNFLVVDDDPNTAELLAILLQERKAQARVFTSYLGFIEAVKNADPAQSVLVIDLIMPRRDGSGVLGGLELLEEVRRISREFRILVMTDHPNREAEQSVLKFGVPALLPKPKKGEVLERRGKEGLTVLVDAITAFGSAPRGALPAAGGLYNIGVELLRELGEEAGSDVSQTPQQSPGLHLLRGMLQELNNPSLGGGIILLILRFASELMNRAVIMLVKDKEIVGLGQFGIELEGGSADVQVRHTRLPTREETLFSEALQSMAPYHRKPDESRWNNYLFDQLGGGRPREVFVGPLISEGRVVAVLYGDNLPENHAIGDTESLEIFLSQAGLAMEKALLERRMMNNRNAV